MMSLFFPFHLFQCLFKPLACWSLFLHMPICLITRIGYAILMTSNILSFHLFYSLKAICMQMKVMKVKKFFLILFCAGCAVSMISHTYPWSVTLASYKIKNTNHQKLQQNKQTTYTRTTMEGSVYLKKVYRSWLQYIYARTTLSWWTEGSVYLKEVYRSLLKWISISVMI